MCFFFEKSDNSWSVVHENAKVWGHFTFLEQFWVCVELLCLDPLPFFDKFLFVLPFLNHPWKILRKVFFDTENPTVLEGEITIKLFFLAKNVFCAITGPPWLLSVPVPLSPLSQYRGGAQSRGIFNCILNPLSFYLGFKLGWNGPAAELDSTIPRGRAIYTWTLVCIKVRAWSWHLAV